LPGTLAPHVGAPAQELLDLALVGVRALDAPHHRSEPQVLAQLEHGLAGRVPVAESGGLEQAVVDSAPEAKLVVDLFVDTVAEPTTLARAQARTPRRNGRIM